MLDGIAGRIAVIPGMTLKGVLASDKLEVAAREKIHHEEGSGETSPSCSCTQPL
jgi:hypothetical protein